MKALDIKGEYLNDYVKDMMVDLSKNEQQISSYYSTQNESIILDFIDTQIKDTDDEDALILRALYLLFLVTKELRVYYLSDVTMTSYMSKHKDYYKIIPVLGGIYIVYLDPLERFAPITHQSPVISLTHALRTLPHQGVEEHREVLELLNAYVMCHPALKINNGLPLRITRRFLNIYLNKHQCFFVPKNHLKEYLTKTPLFDHLAYLSHPLGIFVDQIE